MRAYLGLLALAGGCAGTGTGSVAGTLYLSECTVDQALGSLASPAAFDLHPTYFVADPVSDRPKPDPMNRVSIRIQSRGNQLEEADALYLKVADVEAVGDRVGQALDVGPASNVRATLVLRLTCPNAPVQLELDGKITFSRFGVQTPGSDAPIDFRIQYGDLITAAFDFDVVDRRTIGLGGSGSVDTIPDVAGHLAGDFDFQVRQGRGAQAYP